MSFVNYIRKEIAAVYVWNLASEVLSGLLNPTSATGSWEKLRSLTTGARMLHRLFLCSVYIEVTGCVFYGWRGGNCLLPKAGSLSSKHK